MNRVRTSVALAVLLACAGAARADEALVLRSVGPSTSVPSVAGTLISVDASGVRLASEGTPGGGVVVGWQRVRSVGGNLEREALNFEKTRDALWRMEQRVIRGDYRLAEALAEPLFAAAVKNGSLAGPSGALLAEVVLRCRLARGYSTGAVFAYLDLARVLSERTPGSPRWVGWDEAGIATMDPRWAGQVVLDSDTRLCPYLPPVYSPAMAGRALPALVEAEAWKRLEGQADEVAMLAALYHYAARGEAMLMGAAGERAVALPPLPPLPEGAGDGLRLVHLMVTSRFGDGPAREGARRALEQRILDQLRLSAAEVADASEATPGISGSGLEAPRWAEGWCRLAIGRSLLREEDPARRLEGVIELLHLPARFSDSLPSLAVLALVEAAEELERSGDGTGAAALRMEVQARYPGMLVVEGVGGATSGGAGGAATAPGTAPAAESPAR